MHCFDNPFFLRQLSTSAAGAPLFEIFLTLDGKGNYKKQVLLLVNPTELLSNLSYWDIHWRVMFRFIR